jgi:hypothetical protein
MQHCPSNCHAHQIQSWEGVASGSFNAPDHEYPSYLELTLTATDANGLAGSTTVRLDPLTVSVTFETSPAGLALSVNATTETAPFAATFIVGSVVTISAPTSQSLAGSSYVFVSWSDGGAAVHNIAVPADPTTFRATYAPQ